MLKAILVIALAPGLVCVSVIRGQAPSPEFESADGPDLMPKQLEGVGVEEHLSSPLPLTLKFRDDRGKLVRLGDYFGKGRPIVLSMNYSSCPMLCNVQLNGMADALRDLDWTAGREYDVVSVSINPRETFEEAQLAKKRYVERYGQPGSEDGWHFLTGDEQDIKELARTIGFQYHYVPSQKEYAHPAVFVLASPDGNVMRYVYGVNFDPQMLRLSLVEASEGKVGNTIDKFILYCFHYDAAAGKYAPVARNIMKVGAAGTVLVLALVLATFWARERSRNKAVPPMGEPLASL